MTTLTPTNIQRAPQIWRAALVGYAVLLIVATHWPGSPPEPGVPQHVPPDKLMHFLAFGGFAMLLWTSRWIRHWWTIGLVSLAFVLLDEWTQSVFAVNREASGQDIVAGVLGVLTATAWITALGPSGSAVIRMRDARLVYALNATITNQTELIRVLLAGVIPVIVIALPVYLGLWSLLDIGLGNLALTLGLIGGLSGAAFMLHRCMRTILDAMPDLKPCFECGTSMVDCTPDADGYMDCPNCTARAHQDQWNDESTPVIPMSTLVMTDGFAGLACIALFGLLTVVFIPSLLMPSVQGGLAGVVLYTAILLMTAMIWSWRRAQLATLLDPDVEA